MTRDAKHLRHKQFKVKGDQPLAKVPLSVRLPEDIDEFVRSLPDRNKWLQQAITEKAQAELAEENSVA